MHRYRPWFYGATVYNAVWGTVVVCAPDWVCRRVGLAVVQPVPIFQCVGMLVGVYAYGYYLLARAPERYCGLIWIALLGKTLGPVGYVYSAIRGLLPWSFGWLLLFNDFIWWPAFFSFAWRHGRHPLSHSDGP